MQPTTQITTTDTQELLPWRQPHIVRLDVALDTRFEGGSGTDAGTQTDIRTPA
jgi:hypothetical protein